MCQGVDGVPALLAGCGNDGAQGGEVADALFGAEAIGDLLTQLHHSQIMLGLIVREGNSQVGEAPQTSVLVCLETEGEGVPDAAFFSSALAVLERRLRVVESDGPVEDTIMGFADEIDPGPGPVPAGLACDVQTRLPMVLKHGLHLLRAEGLHDPMQGRSGDRLMATGDRVLPAADGRKILLTEAGHEFGRGHRARMTIRRDSRPTDSTEAMQGLRPWLRRTSSTCATVASIDGNGPTL